MSPSITVKDNTATESRVHDLREAAANAGQKVRECVDTASSELSHATHSIKTHIHEKPVQSSLIALGVGCLIGMLLRR